MNMRTQISQVPTQVALLFITYSVTTVSNDVDHTIDGSQITLKSIFV